MGRVSIVVLCFFCSMPVFAMSSDEGRYRPSPYAMPNNLIEKQPKQHAQIGNINFQYKNNRINLEAHNVTLPKLLSKLQQSTGVRFHYNSLPTDAVTLSLRAATVYEVLAKLFGKSTSYACHYVEATTKKPIAWPNDVWIMGNRTGTAQSKHQQETSDALKSGLSSTEKERNEAEQNFYATELSTLINKAKNGSPAEKKLALVELSLKDDEAYKSEIDALLQEGLKDKDANVRGQVLFGLASKGGEDAMELLQQGLHDEAVSVRINTVNAIDPTDTDNINILQRAASDQNETVRQLALDKLKEAENLGGVR